ncbi:S-methyl-5-thioribose-1-phosphate isomerase [Brevibacillus fluminis]|uniref:S-methyl-5-thioribose-1-phosphate isomerase n=1 Tax=Brevibacillus fluminis TaxID=511487 RepID=UPI003F8C7406
MTYLQSVKWEDDALVLLDQRLLPTRQEYVRLETAEAAWHAIKDLTVRGAPAIGMAAAYGLYLGVRNSEQETFDGFWTELREQSDYLNASRPTAVNLGWALRRMEQKAQEAKHLPIPELKAVLLDEAKRIQDSDEAACRAIGEYGAELLQDGMGILTHCNAGGLATGRYGTALSPIYIAAEKGVHVKVYADETRPVLQGARLTAYELQEAGIDVTLICDNMAAMVMKNGWVDGVIVGADRIAANGDTANKIGTYGVALLAKAHNIPFYVAAPLSTIDIMTPDGSAIPIEERDESEITVGFGTRTAPEGVKVYNPAFDVTPHDYITGIITEKGIIRAPFAESIRNLMNNE